MVSTEKPMDLHGDSSSQEREKSSTEVMDENHVGNGKEDLTMTPEEYKHILSKLDWAIIPYCTLLYLLSFLDRVNIGQAAVAGLRVDLDMVTGNAYQIALSVFFIVGRTRGEI